MSSLWIFPSIGAGWIVFPAIRASLAEAEFLPALRAVSLDQWVGFAVLAVHVVFVVLALHYGRLAHLERS